MLFFVLPMPKAIRQKIQGLKQENRQHFTSAYKDKQYLFFIGLTVLFAFCFFQIFTILPVYLKTQLNVAEEEYGMLMAMNGLIIALFEMVIVYKIERQRRPLRIIKYGVWLVGISFGIYNVVFGQFFLAFISILIITVGEMLSMPFMNTYWISKSNDYNRGQYAALYTMAWGTAQVASPSLGGWIADTYSYNSLWWIVFVITIIAGLGYARLVKEPVKPQQLEPGFS
jgi:predicted MFS family arabinose efflux permease